MNQRPWRRALAWLTFLGPFFFATYLFANAMASRRADVGAIVFPWEHHIPFLAWTILPYWSSDVLYALSLFVCRTRQELDVHAKRLLAIQIFSVACFLLFPLRFTFGHPAASGWEGGLFNALLSFDQPFNQAPSLHASLAVILWVRYRSYAPWFALMALSTLTTYQHHFIDLPTGLWAGLLVIAAFPEDRTARPQVRLTLLYLAGAIACTAAAFLLRGFGWLVLWPAFSLSMVAAGYWSGNPAWLSVKLSMLPVSAAAWINSRLWTQGQPAKNLLTDGVWIGRSHSRFAGSVVNLAAELPIRADAHVPMLDLVPPTREQLDAAVRAITALADRRPTLVCCALGYSRSAAAAAAWLIAAGHARDVDDALAQVARARPQVRVKPDVLAEWMARK